MDRCPECGSVLLDRRVDGTDDDGGKGPATIADRLRWWAAILLLSGIFVIGVCVAVITTDLMGAPEDTAPGWWWVLSLGGALALAGFALLAATALGSGDG